MATIESAHASMRDDFARIRDSDSAKTSRETAGTASARNLVEPLVLFALVEQRLAGRTSSGALAYLAIDGPNDCDEVGATDPDFQSPHVDNVALTEFIGKTLGSDDIFCRYGGQFIIFIAEVNRAQRSLRLICRGIANREWRSRGMMVHLTPIVGYLDISAASSIRNLWELAEQALEKAGSSLEIEPFRLVPSKLSRRPFKRSEQRSVRSWRTPRWLILTFQLVVSLLIGLGAPFVLYAICDALGADIAGPIYIGVVIVLVITATTIWIEGFLALRRPKLPAAGSPYPPATLIIPAYLPNEADTIMETLRAFLRLRYANTVQIIIAYNSPRSLPVEIEMAALAAEHASQGQFVIEPVRISGSTSKAQNVNAVIGRVKGRFVGIFDADHHPHADSLERAWRWLSNGWDIVQGRCAIRNGTDTWVARMVAVEFEQIYAVSHPGRARMHGFGIFGGSNGFWRTSVLHETRMRQSMLTEDIDSSIRAITAGYRITGDRDLVSEELAPTALTPLLNQRLRWAQGWLQVSFRRVLPALISPRVTLRQKLGLLHLLVWRELFPWYSIQVVPIMTYWVWVYGWAYIQWTIPIFLLTTIYTISTGPGQILIAYYLAQRPMRRRAGWFIEYLFVSTLFYSPFKDTLSRIAHVKEAMREKQWKVTPRVTKEAGAKPASAARFAAVSLVVLLFAIVLPNADRAYAVPTGSPSRSTGEMIGILLGGEASTINAARTAARQGRNAQAATLFEKAIRDVPRRRGELLGEYADALAYSNQAARAAALYRELLASTREPGARQDLGARLAQALTWSRQYGAALETYDQLLARDPRNRALSGRRAAVLAALTADARQGRGDEPRHAVVSALPQSASQARISPVDAELRRAGVLFQQRRIDEAQRAYRAAYALDGSNRQARAGIFDTTIAQARADAQRNANEEAQALFASAIRTEPSRRREVLREYADQLTFTGRSIDAIPLYAEVLQASGLSAGDRKQAGEGLANAYVWAGRLPEAIAIYDGLIAAYPEDTGLRWSRTVVAARQAALTNHNAASADLFAKAIALDPGRGDAILREYADQLSFTDRAPLAIPLYRRVLARTDLGAADRLLARKGLAQAYEWSDQLDLAKREYADLLEQSPADVAFRWNLLVVSARIEARADRNHEAAGLFARAIKLDPRRSEAVLAEYADQLSFSGRSQAAIGFYRIAANRPGLSPAQRSDIALRQAQAYDWAGRYAEAHAMYADLLAADPGNVLLGWHLLVTSARAAGAEDRNKDAARSFAQAIALVPARRMSILKEYADKLTYAGQSKLAIPLYREVLAAHPPPAQAHEASLSLALALSYNDRPGQAYRAYKTLADANPDDPQAALGEARSLSWAGRQSDAKAAYRRILSAHPDDGEALRGMAQAEDWDGRHREAQALLARRLAREPGDLEARQLLAQSLVWSGRPDKAMEEVRRALDMQKRPGAPREPIRPRTTPSLGELGAGSAVSLASRATALGGHGN